MDVHVCGKKHTEQVYIHVHTLFEMCKLRKIVRNLHADWLPASGLYCFSPPDVENIFSSSGSFLGTAPDNCLHKYHAMYLILIPMYTDQPVCPNVTYRLPQGTQQLNVK